MVKTRRVLGLRISDLIFLTVGVTTLAMVVLWFVYGSFSIETWVGIKGGLIAGVIVHLLEQ